MVQLALRAHRSGIDPRHVENRVEQARQTVDLPGRDPCLIAALFRREFGRVEIADGGTDCGQRRPQVVTERRQQRGRQLGALARQLGFGALVEEVRGARARWRRCPATASRVPGSSVRPPVTSRPVARVPIRTGVSAIGPADVASSRVPAVGACAGVELERAGGGRESAIEIRLGNLRRLLAAMIDVPAARRPPERRSRRRGARSGARRAERSSAARPRPRW